MTRSAAVSVLITAYHPEPVRFADALNGLTAQTADDVEVVLVVDGELGSEAEDVLDHHPDPRRRVLRPGRVGRGPALNVGLAATQSALVAIQDADDRSHPDRLAWQATAMARRPDLSLLAGTALRRYDLGVPDPWRLPEDARVKTVDAELLIRNPFVHSAVMFRRAAVMGIGGYSEDRPRLLDYDLYLRLRADGCHLGIIDAPVVVKRMHAHQAFESDPAGRRARSGPYRLQLSHVRAESGARRALYGAAATAWVPMRWARTALGQRRVRRRAGSQRR